MTILTKTDKLQLITSHQRSIEYSKYGLELDILQESAKSVSNQEEISRLEDLVDEADRQLAALNAERVSVEAIVE
jgi:hypothetical protein